MTFGLPLLAGLLFTAFLGVSSTDSGAKEKPHGRVFIVSWAQSKQSDSAAQRERGIAAAKMVLQAAQWRFPQAIAYERIEGKNGSSGQSFPDTLRTLAQRLTPRDSVLIYTHSHGSPRGLMLDELLTWKEYGQLLLSLRARHVLVFTMSCFSGALVEYLTSVHSQWKERPSQGRALLVISAQNATSLAGPNQIGGKRMNGLPYALSEALYHADGYGGQPRDGRLSFQELAQFVYTVSRSAGSRPRYFNDSQMARAYRPQEWVAQ